MKKKRIFIAVPVPSGIRKAATILQQKLGEGLDNIQWVPGENMHFTLQFLGDVEELMIPGVCRCAQDAVANFKPFQLHVIGAGAFPDLDRPRTLWLGTTEGSETLTQMNNAIGENLRTLPVRREKRSYHPHLTLGRVQGKQTVLDAIHPRLMEHAETEVGTMTIDKVTVFASELSRAGAKYHVLGSAKLGK